MKKIILLTLAAMILASGCSKKINYETDLRIEKRHISQFEQREKNIKIDTCIIHSTEHMDSVDELIRYFEIKRISSHYLITRKGGIVELVPSEYEAFHAGKSIMPFPDNRVSVNRFSVGIELIAEKSKKSAFTEEQYLSLARLCAYLEKKNGALRYLGHSDVAGKNAIEHGLRPKYDFKKDPENFEWKRFYKTLDYFLSTTK
jgi:N-acetyl-anhydromuramyl-L-alanine amidase AmpD